VRAPTPYPKELRAMAKHARSIHQQHARRASREVCVHHLLCQGCYTITEAVKEMSWSTLHAILGLIFHQEGQNLRFTLSDIFCMCTLVFVCYMKTSSTPFIIHHMQVILTVFTSPIGHSTPLDVTRHQVSPTPKCSDQWSFDCSLKFILYSLESISLC
jgi:hypothetical protein